MKEKKVLKFPKKTQPNQSQSEKGHAETGQTWAIVAGVSSGTGQSIAYALAKEHKWNIFGIHRGNYPDSASELKEKITALGCRCEFWEGNGAKIENIESALNYFSSIATPNSVKMFVHSMADASYGRFCSGEKDQLHPKQIHKTMEVMANSFIYWSQALVGGNWLMPNAHLLGLTNPIVDSLATGFGMIVASKYALEGYVKGLAMELGPLGHRTNLLKFGLVETPAIRMAFTDERFEMIKEGLRACTPSHEIATTEEVGAMVSLLADDRSKHFNGTVLDFTAGQMQSLLNLVFNPERGELDVSKSNKNPKRDPKRGAGGTS